MNTKYLYKALTVVGMLSVFTGCKKYLDQQPITELNSSVAFENVPNAYNALMGVYSRLAGQEGYGQRLSLYYTVDTDEMQGPTGTDDERRNIARYQPTPSNTGLPRPFTQLFQGIEFANHCILNIPKMSLYTTGSEQQKKQLQRMYGEALALRAQFYFEAIRNWGDLPEHFEIAANLAEAKPSPFKVDRDSLYDRLLADLKIAADIVPWKNELAAIGDANDERLTKGAVKGIRARIALYRGGYSLRQQSKIMERKADYLSFYQMAKDELNSIINSGQHALNPNYKNLWKEQVGKRAVTDPQGELMFQVSAIGAVAAEDSRLGFYDGPRVNALGNSAINVLPTYFYLFDSLDIRRDVTIAPYNVAVNGISKIALGSAANSAAVLMNPGKFRRDWNTAVAPTFTGQFLGLKWQILRYADVLLMFAEAENEINGPTNLAYNAVNMVRRRGFGKPINTVDLTVDLPVGLDKATFFRYLVKERSLELGGEGVRKYDLLRWNLMATALTETKANLTKLSTFAAMAPYTYMAQPPVYAMVSTLPTSMYFKSNANADDVTLWSNSFYKPAPAATPTGNAKVAWLSAQINTICLARFATGFTPGRSELFPIPQPARDANPNFAQNPGY